MKSKKLVILGSSIYDADPKNSSMYGGPVAPIVGRLEKLDGVIAVKASRLFSLQVDMLTKDDGITVIIVDMALRYDDVAEYLQEHQMHLVEFHRKSRSEWPGVDARQWTDDDDLVRQIEAL